MQGRAGPGRAEEGRVGRAGRVGWAGLGRQGMAGQARAGGAGQGRAEHRTYQTEGAAGMQILEQSYLALAKWQPI